MSFRFQTTPEFILQGNPSEHTIKEFALMIKNRVGMYIYGLDALRALYLWVRCRVAEPNPIPHDLAS